MKAPERREILVKQELTKQSHAMDLCEIFELNQGVHTMVTGEDGNPVFVDDDHFMVHSSTDNSLHKVQVCKEVCDFFGVQVNCDKPVPEGTLPGAVAPDATTSTTSETPCDEDSSSGFRWKDPAIRLLIAVFKEKEEKLNSGKMSCVKFWGLVADALVSKNYIVTGPQCKTKMASLKKMYKSVNDHNNKSGNDRRTWQYLELMDDVFGSKPWVAPLKTIQSTAASAPETPSSSSEPPKKRAKTTSNELLAVLQNNAEERRKMHQDLLQRQDEFLSLMRQMVQNDK